MNTTLRKLGIDRMSVEDRLQLIGDIWDSLDYEEEISEDVRAELDKRLAAADANPEAGIPWELALARLQAEK